MNRSDDISKLAEAPPPGPTVWERLRAPFPAEQIEKRKGAGGMMLDYVSHAHVRDRLNQVDPTWTWQPIMPGLGEARFDFTRFTGDYEVTVYEGREKHVETRHADNFPVGLWIALTVCGVTKVGYGDVAPGAFNPEKQLIGDAIRNAAMNFGVAIALWMKDESPGETVTTARATPSRTATPRADGNGHKVTEDAEAPHCPDDACDGRLRERTTKKGDPYLSCDRRCGITPLWNTTTEQYKSRLGGQAWGEEGEPEHSEVSAAALLEVVGKDEAEQIFQAHSALPALKIVAGKPGLREMEWNALDGSIRQSIGKALANTEIPL